MELAVTLPLLRVSWLRAYPDSGGQGEHTLRRNRAASNRRI
jgi:hypothetical protein